MKIKDKSVSSNLDGSHGLSLAEIQSSWLVFEDTNWFRPLWGGGFDFYTVHLHNLDKQEEDYSLGMSLLFDLDLNIKV